MKRSIEARAKEIAEYICKTQATVRETAKLFSISKSTVHKDVTERLQHIDPALHARVQTVLSHNLQIRHIRGGQATQAKYQKQKR